MGIYIGADMRSVSGVVYGRVYHAISKDFDISLYRKIAKELGVTLVDDRFFTEPEVRENERESQQKKDLYYQCYVIEEEFGRGEEYLAAIWHTNI